MTQRTVVIRRRSEAVDKIVGSQDNIFAARHRFQQMRQLPNETVDAFLNRLQQAVQSCDYKNIPSSKVEDMMLLQALILGIRDNKTRDWFFRNMAM